MTATAPPLRPVLDARAAERRRVGIPGQVREARSSSMTVDVVDLSTTGFRFESFYAFALGRRVFLSIPTLGQLEAAVAWRDERQFGCRFVRPLHPAVFDTIAARFP